MTMNAKEIVKAENVPVPQLSFSDRLKQWIADYGIIALIILAIGAYIALNDKLLELNRSMGRLEGQLQILEQQRLPAPTP
jgi:hypothetical protein